MAIMPTIIHCFFPQTSQHMMSWYSGAVSASLHKSYCSSINAILNSVLRIASFLRFVFGYLQICPYTLSMTDGHRLSVFYRSNSVPVRVCDGPFRSFHPELRLPVDSYSGTAERARARMFLAAFASLSISSPHAGQTSTLTEKSFITISPQLSENAKETCENR